MSKYSPEFREEGSRYKPEFYDWGSGSPDEETVKTIAPVEESPSLVDRAIDFITPEGEQLGTSEELGYYQVPEDIRTLYASPVDSEALAQKLQSLEGEQNLFNRIFSSTPDKEDIENKESGILDAIKEGRNFAPQLMEKLVGGGGDYYNLQEILDEEGRIPVQAIQRLNLPRNVIARLMAGARSRQLGIPEQDLLDYAKVRGLGDDVFSTDSLKKMSAEVIDNAKKRGIEITPQEANRIVSNDSTRDYAFRVGLADLDNYTKNLKPLGEGNRGQAFSSEFFMGVPDAIRREFKERTGELTAQGKGKKDYAEQFGYSEILENAIAEAKKKQEPVEFLLPNIGGIFSGEITVDPEDSLEDVKKAFNEEFLDAALGDMEDLGTSSLETLGGNIASMVFGGGVLKAGTKLPKIAKMLDSARKAKFGKAAVGAGLTGIGLGTGIAGSSLGAPTGQQDLYAEMGLKLGGLMTGLGAGVLGGTTLAKAGADRLSSFWKTGQDVPLTKVQKAVVDGGEDGLVKILASESYDDLPEDLKFKVSREDYIATKNEVQEVTKAEARLRNLIDLENFDTKSPSRQKMAYEIFTDELQNNPSLRETIDTISMLKQGMTPESAINRMALQNVLNSYNTSMGNKGTINTNKLMIDLEGLFQDSEQLVNYIRENELFGTLTPTVIDSFNSKVHGGAVSIKDAYFKEAVAILNTPFSNDVDSLITAEKVANSPFLKNHFGALRKQENIGAKEFLLEDLQKAKKDLTKTHAEAINKITDDMVGMPKDDFVEFVVDNPTYISDVVGTKGLPDEVKNFIRESKILDTRSSKILARKTRDYYKEKAVSRYTQRDLSYTKYGQDIEAGARMKGLLNTPVEGIEALYEVPNFARRPSDIRIANAVDGIQNSSEELSFRYFERVAPDASEEEVLEVVRAIKSGTVIDDDVIKTPAVRKVYEAYDTNRKILEKATYLYENANPLIATESLDRLATMASVKSVKDEIATLLYSKADEFEGVLDNLPLDATSKAKFMKVLKSNSTNLDDGSVTVARPQTIIDASNVATKEIVEHMAATFKMLTGENLNKLEFLAHYLGRNNGYDFAQIYGRSLANVASRRNRNLKAGGWFHRQLMTTDYLARSIGDNTASAIYDATVDLHNGVKQAKSFSRDVIKEYTEELKKIPLHNSQKTLSIVNSVVGHEGIKKFISVVKEDGTVEYNALGKLVREMFTEEDYSKLSVKEARDRIREKLSRRWGDLADPEVDSIEGLLKPDVEDFLVNYWYREDVTPKNFEAAFKVYELSSKYEASSFKAANEYIENLNSLNRHGVKVPPYRWREDKYTGRRYTSMPFEDGEGVFGTRDPRWGKLESSSRESQLDKARNMSLVDMDNPYRSFSQGIVSRFMDAFTVHSKEKIALNAENLADIGMQDAAETILQMVAEHGSRPNVLSTMARNVTRSLEINPKVPTFAKTIIADTALLKNSFLVNPTLSMASIMKAARNTAQGKTWMLATTRLQSSNKYFPLITPLIEVMKIPFTTTARIIEGVTDASSAMVKGKGSMTKEGVTELSHLIVRPDSELRSINIRLLKQAFDNPLTAVQRNMDTFTSIGAEEGVGSKALNKFSDVGGKFSDAIMVHFKEKFEAALAKDVLKQAERSFLQLEEYIQGGQFDKALSEMNSMLRLHSDADRVNLLNQIRNQPDRGKAYYIYGQNIIDASVGRFGTQANSIGIRKIGQYLPNLQLFYTSKMMVPLGIHRAISKAVRSGGNSEALKATGAFLTYLTGFVGLSSVADSYLGTDLLDYSVGGATVADLEGLGVLSAPTSGTDILANATTALLTGLPSGRGTIGKGSFQFGTTHTLKASSSILGALSTSVANLVSKEAPLKYDLIERYFGDIREDYARWVDMPNGFEKDQLGQRISSRYQIRVDTSPDRLIETLLMETGPFQFLRDFMSNPYLYFYAMNEYNTDNLFMNVASQDRTRDFKKGLATMGIFDNPFMDVAGYLFNVETDQGRDVYLNQLSQKIAYLNRLGVGFSDDTIKRIIERHGKIYDENYGIERATDSRIPYRDDYVQRMDMLSQGVEK